MRYLLFLLVVFTEFGIAQSDTILQGYLSHTGNSSLINEMLVLENDRYGLLQPSSDFDGFEVNITDLRGDVIYHELVDSVNGFNITFSSYMFEANGNYYYIANGEKNDQNYYLSIESDTELEDFSVVDSIELDQDVHLYFEMMKYNSTKMLWEGFGVLEQNNTGEMMDNIYLSLNKNFSFVNYHELSGISRPYPVLDFVWLAELDCFFIRIFGEKSMLISNNFEFLWEQSIMFVYKEDEITYHSPLRVTSILLNPLAQDEVYCYGVLGADEDFGITKLIINKDSIQVLERNRFSKMSGLKMSSISLMDIDSEGNYVITGIDRISFSSSKTSPNTLGVLKLSPDFDILWQLELKNDKSYAIWDMEVDDNDDILVVGQSQNIFENNEFHGFLLKIFKDGTYTTTYTLIKNSNMEVLVFPNPTDDYLQVVFKEKNNEGSILSIFNQNGQQVLVESLKDQKSSIDLQNLVSGSYHYTISYKGTNIYNGALIKQ